MKIKHIEKIRTFWNAESEGYCSNHGEHLDQSLHPSWGLFHIHENNLRLIMDDITSTTTLVELGCGRGHDAVAFAELGATVIAVDVSDEQLRRAIPHPRVRNLSASAESLPIGVASVDIVISDHGAFDHSPPSLLLKEVARVLRPGGLLVVCAYSPLAFACHNASTGKLSAALQHPYPSDAIRFNGKITAVEYSYASWVKAFCAAGFEILRLEELRPAPDAPGYFSDLDEADWASRWPCDIVWKVKKKPE